MKVIPGGISMSSQMSLIRDTEEVVKFLEFAGKKLILDSHAVNCRLTACHNLFSVLNEEEDQVDFMIRNLDLLVNRLRNKNRSVNEGTLKVYKSRFKSTLEDYKAWAADPFAWERQVTEKSKEQAAERIAKERVVKRRVVKAPRSEPRKKGPAEGDEAEDFALSESSVPVSDPVRGLGRSLSLPIRDGVDVQVVIPEGGITFKELQRIGMFLYPYCKDSEDQHSFFSERKR